MALLSRARALLRGPEIQLQPDEVPTIVGRRASGRRTKDLVKRLGPATSRSSTTPTSTGSPPRTWSRAGSRAVVNVAESSTGRYPNPGPLVLARAGVPLIDAPAAPLFEELADGDQVVIEGGALRANGGVLATGRVIDLDDRDRADRATARADQRGARRLRR